MVRRPDLPYWMNWVGWQAYHRHRSRKAHRRQAAWDFINLLRQSPPGSLAIDGGANVGNVTAAFLRYGFEVHAFEPDPYAGSILAHRFAANGHVHLHTNALGNAPGTLKLFRTQDFSRNPRKQSVASSLIAREVHDGAGAIEVEVVDLVAFIEGLGRRVDILKLDVEGSEVGILERILDLRLDRRIGAIFVETHERFSVELGKRTERLRRRIAAEKIGNINLDWM